LRVEGLALNPTPKTWTPRWRAAEVAVPSARESINHEGVGVSWKY